ncbi:unnamed protein product [Lymnaea stagnalis]|uniref:Outer dense fiber protein 3 n=1 Tax=Lymnaea stagnalis TaxID=6523 RepID=A0AAV2H3K0_LYMST
MSLENFSAHPSAVLLISDEERAALGKFKLEEDLSDSSEKSAHSTPPVVVLKHKKLFIGPPIPKHRDGMGRYVPSYQGKPLSAQDEPTPGPADYVGDYTVFTHKFPIYSLGERPAEAKRKKGYPAPNKYNMMRTFDWGRCKGITLKKRVFPPDKDTKLLPGPANYAPSRDISTGPKYSIGLKQDKVIPGLMSRLAQIIDPNNPGPSFIPPEDDWLQKPKSFGIKPKSAKPPSGPGPGKYNFRSKFDGPKWKHGLRLPSDRIEDLPGPASYDNKPSIGEGPKYHIGKAIPISRNKFVTPGPDMYNRAGFRLDEPGYTLKYRWFDQAKKKTPGPSSYHCHTDAIKVKNPAYSIKHKCKTTYPSYIYAGEYALKGPGPADYDISRNVENKGKSFGESHRTVMEDPMPGPADYQDIDLKLPGLPEAPMYSFGDKPLVCPDEDSPGPQTYDVKFDFLGKPVGKTIAGKSTLKPEISDSPGPMAYDVTQFPRRCAHPMGPSVSSRHTPNKYLGMKNTALIPKQPRNFPTAPLLG